MSCKGSCYLMAVTHTYVFFPHCAVVYMISGYLFFFQKYLTSLCECVCVFYVHVSMSVCVCERERGGRWGVNGKI